MDGKIREINYERKKQVKLADNATFVNPRQILKQNFCNWSRLTI